MPPLTCNTATQGGGWATVRSGPALRPGIRRDDIREEVDVAAITGPREEEREPVLVFLAIRRADQTLFAASRDIRRMIDRCRPISASSRSDNAASSLKVRRYARCFLTRAPSAMNRPEARDTASCGAAAECNVTLIVLNLPLFRKPNQICL